MTPHRKVFGMRNRRGSTILLVALISVTMLTFLAVVVDMSRMYTQKNELQTAADAAALAGMIAHIEDTSLTVDSARSFGIKQTVLQSPITVATADVVCGKWDDVNHIYLGDSDHCGPSENAVTVTVRDSARYIFTGLLGTTKQVTAMGRSYAANVGATQCVKPWAMEYSVLTKLLQPGNTDYYRDLDAYDIEQLKTRTPAQLTFTLRSQTNTEALGPANYGSLNIANPDPDAPKTDVGGSLYRYNIGHCNLTLIGPGDILTTKPGGTTGPTLQGAEDYCQPLANNGDCMNADGTVGIKTKTALWSQATDKGNGTYDVTVRQIVAWKLMHIVPNGQTKGDVSGYFLPLKTGGAITTTVTTIQRPILVQ